MIKKDINSAELETVRCPGVPESDDGCDSQRRSANKRSDRVCQSIGFIRDSEASRRYTGPFSHSENLAKIMDIPTSGPVVRHHISSKMADG